MRQRWAVANTVILYGLLFASWKPRRGGAQEHERKESRRRVLALFAVLVMVVGVVVGVLVLAVGRAELCRICIVLAERFGSVVDNTGNVGAKILARHWRGSR